MAEDHVYAQSLDHFQHMADRVSFEYGVFSIKIAVLSFAISVCIMVMCATALVGFNPLGGIDAWAECLDRRGGSAGGGGGGGAGGGGGRGGGGWRRGAAGGVSSSSGSSSGGGGHNTSVALAGGVEDMLTSHKSL